MDFKVGVEGAGAAGKFDKRDFCLGTGGVKVDGFCFSMGDLKGVWTLE